MPPLKVAPKLLRPYLFHGVSLCWSGGDEQATGDCPFCHREGKFAVNVNTGVWRCWVCARGTDKGGGNIRTFLCELWKDSSDATQDYTELVDRKLAEETLICWEVVRSTLSGNWLVPGYDVQGRLSQLYQYVLHEERKVLLPTPGLGHQLHGVNLYNKSKPAIYLCEGPWDGMALWEALRQAKPTAEGLTATANPNASLLAAANVLAVPGCNVFLQEWLPLFADKNVYISYDNDHPKQGRPAAYLAMQRVARMLHGIAAEMYYLCWGPDGYDPNHKSGYDVRDWLTQIT